MSRNLEVALTLRLNGQDAFVSGMRRQTEIVNRFGQVARQQIGHFNQLGNATRRALSGSINLVRTLHTELNGLSVIGRLTATLGGLTLARTTLRSNLDFHRNLLEMKQTGEMSAGQSAQAKTLALQVAGDALQLPEDVLSGLRAFTSAGEKFEFATQSIAESSRAATAYFSSAETVAKLDVDARQKLGIQPEQQRDMHNMLLYHGRAGRYEVGAMAQDAPKTFNTMANAGFTGIEAVNLTGALTQQLMKLAPATQPAEVATFMEHFFGHLTQKHYVKGLADKGIDIKKYMPGGYFGGVDKSGRPIGGQVAVDGLFAFLRALKAKNLNDPFKLSEAGFRDMYTSKAAKQMLSNVDALQTEMGNGSIAAKSDLVGAAVAEIKEASFGKIKAAEVNAEKLKLSDQATKATGKTADLAQWAMENPGKAIGASIAAAVAGKWAWGKGLPRLMEWGGAKLTTPREIPVRPAMKIDLAGAPLNTAEIRAWERRYGNSAVQPSPGVLGRVATGSPELPAQAKPGVASGVGWKLNAAAALGFAGYEAWQIGHDPQLSQRQKNIAYSGLAGGTAGSIAGGWGGAAMGAAIGTALLPGIGTILGGLVGGLGGSLLGGYAGEKVGALAGNVLNPEQIAPYPNAALPADNMGRAAMDAMSVAKANETEKLNVIATKLQATADALSQPLQVKMDGRLSMDAGQIVAYVNSTNTVAARRN